MSVTAGPKVKRTCAPHSIIDPEQPGRESTAEGVVCIEICKAKVHALLATITKKIYTKVTSRRHIICCLDVLLVYFV